MQNENDGVGNNPITQTNNFRSMFQHHGNQCLKFHFVTFLNPEEITKMRCTCKIIKQAIPQSQYSYFKTADNRGRARIETNTGFVETRGNPRYGGDSSEVRSELQSDVKNIFSTALAFAALKKNGRVITWGDSNYGGDSSSVSEFLQNGVIHIEAVGENKFRATKSDGTQIQWP